MQKSDLHDGQTVYSILINTLSSFFEMQLVARRNIHHISLKNNPHVLYYIPKINAIFCSHAPRKKIIEFIKTIYVGNQDCLKRILIILYIIMSVSFPSLFSKSVFQYTNESNIFNNLLIFPGNKRIKVIDFDTSTITNVIKSDYSHKWFNNDIVTRNSKKYSFMNSVISFGTNHFTESLLTGTPFARIDINNQGAFLPKIFDIISQFQSDLKTVNVGSYSAELSDFIVYKLNTSVDSYSYVTEITDYLRKILVDQTYSVALSSTHGDFQKGNIFITTSNEVIILDWETFAERFSLYDYLILLYNLRNSFQLINNFSTVLKEDRIPICVNSFPNRSHLLALFILEDIKWQIEETSEFPFGIISVGLKMYNSVNILEWIMANISKE